VIDPRTDSPGPTRPVEAAGPTQPRPAIQLLTADEPDPGIVISTCANCGAPMTERKCKLICRCGYFLSCSDYY
jgi:hypothetical protein